MAAAETAGVGSVTPEQRQHDFIKGKLAELELETGVEILFAVESGSRAWGFASPDSDWDVRFVYRQPAKEYVRLVKQPDTLGRSAKGDLYDITGWDVAKALKQALSSNATLLEWLRSPIRYRWEPEVEAVAAMCERLANPRSLTWNYFNLCRHAEEEFRKTEKLKKYLYAVRCAMSLRHVRMFPSAVPPMNIQQLVEAVDLSPDEEESVHQLVRLKQASLEADTVSEIGMNLMRDFVLGGLAQAEASKPEKTTPVSDAKLLELTERVFVKTIGLEL